MNRKLDIEDLLMRFRIIPGARVKRAVLAKYAERHGRARGGAGTINLWKRPVPLYLAAALIVLAAGLSFIGGQKLSRSERTAESPSIAMQDSLIRVTLKQSLQFAPRDVF
jgi:hypothetical protein